MSSQIFPAGTPLKIHSSQYYRVMSLVKNGLVGLFVVCVILFTIFPFYWMLKSSFQTPADILALPPIWFPSTFTLDAYIRAVTLYPIPRYLLNSLLVSTATAILATALASSAAYVIARYKFRGATFFLGIFIFTQLIPGITRIFPIYFLIQDLGLINTYPGLILAYLGFSVPFSALMLQGYFRSSCPPELEEAALIDGCNDFTAFTKVMIPVSMPGIAAVSIFTFLGAWNDFLWASMILNQGQMKTLQIGLRDFMSESGTLTRINSFMAACVIATIPALLMYSILQRNMVAGLSAGSMKG